tara:strand:+ start:1065 stop:1787 length:723 start_codon:yes stop_codon:yes gene_type:complete
MAKKQDIPVTEVYDSKNKRTGYLVGSRSTPIWTLEGAKFEYSKQLKALNKPEKPKKPQKLQFTNPTTGKTETVLDSSAYKTRIGYLKDKEEKDLRSRSSTLVDKILQMESQLKVPSLKDKHELIKSNLNTSYGELEEISKQLGEPYQRPSGDANIEQGSSIFKTIKGWVTPSDEDAFKANTRKEIMRKIGSGELKPPSGIDGYSWARSEADRLWSEKTNKPDLSKMSREDLFKGAESDGE